MNRVGGIDEAGLGPILGPLVMAGVAFDLPGLGTDPHELLREVVHRCGGGGDAILVDDSKRVCSGPHGIARVERTALTFLALAWGTPPATAAELARRLLVGGGEPDRTGCPWLEELALALPFAVSPGLIELDAWRLERACARAGVGCPHLVVAALHPGPFNARIQVLDNKALAHYELLTQVLGGFLPLAPVEVVADRPGGRSHHGSLLARGLPGVGVTILAEEAERQGYRLAPPRRPPMTVWFEERGEEGHFSVALASCLAKYTREVFMECQNRWFLERQPGLKPTRGYYVDGLRFLREARGVIQAEKLRRDAFVRNR